MSEDPARRDAEGDFVRATLSAIEAHNPARRGHGERVSTYAVAAGCNMGMGDEELRGLRCAAAIHDVWKLELARQALEAPGPLRSSDLPASAVLMPMLAIRRLREQEPWPWLEWICYQYFWFDGSIGGEPRGRAIPLASRILHACIAFDAMTTAQPWREARPTEEALAELRECSGSQFDGEIVEALAEALPLIQPLPHV